jgi:hypothetical protein
MIFCISEEDAKTKWCPFARASNNSDDISGTTINRNFKGKPDIDCACLASGCMAWRWVDTHIKDDSGNLTVLSGDTHGYCGLAGKEWVKR